MGIFGKKTHKEYDKTDAPQSQTSSQPLNAPTSASSPITNNNDIVMSTRQTSSSSSTHYSYHPSSIDYREMNDSNSVGFTHSRPSSAAYEYAIRQYSQTLRRPGLQDSTGGVGMSDMNTNGNGTMIPPPPPPPPPNPPSATKRSSSASSRRSKSKTRSESPSKSNSQSKNKSKKHSKSSHSSLKASSSLSYSNSYSPSPDTKTRKSIHTKTTTTSNNNNIAKPEMQSRQKSIPEQYTDEDSSSLDDYSDSDSSSSDLDSNNSASKANSNSNSHSQATNTVDSTVATNTQSLLPSCTHTSDKTSTNYQNNSNDKKDHYGNNDSNMNTKTTQFSNVPINHIHSNASYYSYPNYPGSPQQRHTTGEHKNSNYTNKYFHNPHHYNHHDHDNKSSTSSYATSQPEPEMVDVTYSETYGEAYINKPIRYIYPNGYNYLRPRSRPWQLSVIICLGFAYLNVFIIGHCSDQFESNNGYENYNQNNNGDDGNGNYNNQYLDDDQYRIETRWCGSRPLYMMWVLSVIVNGLSCAYCSIVGYIKARDFSVANNRSQMPGMVGKSDYYVKVEEELSCKGNRRFSTLGNSSSTVAAEFGKNEDNNESFQSDGENQGYKKTMYQADGTPRYFGGRIYRPTQAAINITSR